MGLKLRVNCFYQQDHKQIYEVLSDFHLSMGKSFEFSGDQFSRLDIYQYDEQWVLLDLGGGWNQWETHQQAFRQISVALQCTGFSMFVDDGDYWGYTMVHSGNEIDHFIQDPGESRYWFPGVSSIGNAQTISDYLLYLKADDISPYLIQMPSHVDDAAFDELWASWWDEYNKLDVMPRRGDEFTRWDECSLLNFQRLLGIRVELRDHYVKYLAPIWKSFWIQQI